MSATRCASQVFLERLPLKDRQWLSQLWQHACKAPPKNWVHWTADHIHLGWLDPERAEWLLRHLPHCRWAGPLQLIWGVTSLSSAERSALLLDLLIRAWQENKLHGWRHEMLNWWLESCEPPLPQRAGFFQTERAGFRYLGLMSHAVHINGFLPNGDMWCGRRALTKTLDPGLLDNITAGGLTSGESPLQAALRELSEEAGLTVSGHRLHYVDSIRTQRAVNDGWHDERLLVFNLLMHETEFPQNLDGEVDIFLCLTPGQWLERLRGGEFTTDAAMALVCGLGMTPAQAR